jgi:hypothetical protein
MRFAVLGAFALLLLAGCSSSGGSNPTPGGSNPSESDFPTASVDVKPTDTTGIIKGVVVDQGIRPLPGVAISIEGKTAKTVTNTEGAFGFADLVPGTYFLKAHKAGYHDVQQAADVVAGVADPDPVRIKLQADPSGTPYAEPYVLHGFLECGQSNLAICAVAEVPEQTLCYGNPNIPTDPHPGVCLGKTTQDQFSSFQMVSPNIMYLQAELVWKSTQSLGDQLHLVVRGADYGNWKQGYYSDSFGGATGPSPVIYKASDDNVKLMNDRGIGNGTGDQAHGMEYDIFAAGSPTGLVVEQKFDIYTTVFHGYKPPEGWSLYTNGEPPPP